MERQGLLYFISWDGSCSLFIRNQGHEVCLFADRYVCQSLNEYLLLIVLCLSISMSPLSVRRLICLSFHIYHNLLCSIWLIISATLFLVVSNCSLCVCTCPFVFHLFSVHCPPTDLSSIRTSFVLCLFSIHCLLSICHPYVGLFLSVHHLFAFRSFTIHLYIIYLLTVHMSFLHWT